jgi:hypothetical protein
MHKQELLAEPVEKSPGDKAKKTVREDVGNREGVYHHGGDLHPAWTVFQALKDDTNEREARKGDEKDIGVVSSTRIPTGYQFWIEGVIPIRLRARFTGVGFGTLGPFQEINQIVIGHRVVQVNNSAIELELYACEVGISRQTDALRRLWSDWGRCL